MNLLYNSDQFAVVQIDWPEAPQGDLAESAGEPGQAPAAGPTAAAADEPGAQTLPVLVRGGYEIVDKLARKGLFIEGNLAQQFRLGVQALVDGGPDAEALDAYMARYTALAQQPLVMH